MHQKIMSFCQQSAACFTVIYLKGKAVISLRNSQIRKYAKDGCEVFFVRDCSFAYLYLRILIFLINSPGNIA